MMTVHLHLDIPYLIKKYDFGRIAMSVSIRAEYEFGESKNCDPF